MAILFYHFPVAILATGITEMSLHNILRFAIGSYLEEYQTTIIEARDDMGFQGGDEDQCRAVFESYKNCQVKTAISRDLYWQWRDNIENESDYSKLLLLGFLAVKSIVGKKDYAITNYNLLLARMAGDSVPRYKTHKGKKELILPQDIKTINTRRRLEKFRDDLARYHVTWWTEQGLRGLAISTKLTQVQLAHAIATNGTKPQAQRRKERKEWVKAKVKELQGLSG